MTQNYLLAEQDLDVRIVPPPELKRIVEQNLIDLTPWHLLEVELAKTRLRGLRQRYTAKYVPFARRQDNDDLACWDPSRPGEVLIIHDFASQGTELRQSFPSFWAWFRAAIEDMIAFE